MNTTGTVSERLRQLDADSRSADNTVAQLALRILGHVAEHHLIALAAALEAHYAGHGELRAIEETLARGWRRKRGQASTLYFRAMFRRTPITTTFIIVLAAFAAAWVSLDVLAYTGFI